MKRSLLILSLLFSNSAFSATEAQERLRILELFQEGEETVRNGPLDTDCKYDRNEPRVISRASSGKRFNESGWSDFYFKDDKQNSFASGFVLDNFGTNSIVNKSGAQREWRFISRDYSKRETFLWITDDPGLGRNSSLMDSMIVIVPRKVRPGVAAVGDEIHVTLATGEKVIFDKKTKVIKSGVLKEAPVDLSPDNARRKFANISYAGTGISIRIDKRGGDPRSATGSATVTQNGVTCKVPSQDLFGPENFKFSDDSKLLIHLNSKCSNKFKL